MKSSVVSHAALLLATGLAVSVGCAETADPDSHPIAETNTGGYVPVGHSGGRTEGSGGTYIIPPDDQTPEGAVCGNSSLEPGEECDDGNTDGADGCTLDCKREPLYICLVPGELCIAEVCGDGSRTASESCDDGNAVSQDGCNAACQVESGWVCPAQGSPCISRCGDGQIAGGEKCDDGNVVAGDGCGAGCLTEPGWFNCPPFGAGCQQAICGNGAVEANEGCDDANEVSGDGCNAACLREPVFDTTGLVAAVCGDGARTLEEACDDGNVLNGDGCSNGCTVELGFECDELAENPEFVRLPVMYRDFSQDHPDFEYRTPGLELGIASEACTVANAATCGALDAEGKPVLNESETFLSTHTAADFGQWYRDVEGVNLPFPSALELARMEEGGQTIYRFESDEFFPLEGLGFGNFGRPEHNYLFTTELQYFIQYAGGERLEFSGDDDVWIYVNRRLAVDIGGVHEVESDFVVLGDENGDGDISATEADDPTDDRFGITKGNLYSIHLFHAERHTIESNFKLTLSNFILSRSVCTPICGSGTLEPGEICDDGVELNTGEYGACAPDCSGREYCGDGVVQAEGGEVCDDGLNLSPYDSVDGCAPGCQIPARCGDGVLDPEYGETCDLGDDMNGVRESTCSDDCRLVDTIR
ncbi:MAG: DUF4215 domain-containing protein [Polyangiaceae bacterium]|nr:DUF4215 domain-containing protein [Polyangiaceae bacterium]